MSTPRIGLALSGGGFRATCFGLGCLRALHDQGLLRNVRVISGISGGSVLTAFYAYGPAEFLAFDSLVVDQLRGCPDRCGISVTATGLLAMRPPPSS
jgi:NTE family protein